MVHKMADANTISDRIRTVTQRCYARDRDNLTVNIVRNIVELELGLEQGTLRSEGWKERSKEGVLGEVVRTCFLFCVDSKRIAVVFSVAAGSLHSLAHMPK